MKLFHLSDLHIGKKIYECSMLEDQRYILAEILEAIDRENPDGVIIAGDIYDKSSPSVEAVRLFDRFLTSLAERKLYVFAISGNHDSPEKFAFGAELMKQSNVYLSPVYDGTIRSVELTDAYGQVCVHLLPFLKPLTVRNALGRDKAGEEDEETRIENYQDALKAALAKIKLDKKKRNILIAHQFITGAKECESEDRQIGGLDQVSASVFEEFDYVALGHLHSPQNVGREGIRYCGTPLKYSFSEAEQDKSITVVELKEKGTLNIRTILLKPARDLRNIRGSYLEVTSRSFCEKMNAERDYFHITLTDEDDVPDGMQKLKRFYPNLLKLEYDNARTRENQMILFNEETERKSELELFEDFYERQNNQPMSEKQKDFTRRMIEKIRDGRTGGEER